MVIFLENHQENIENIDEEDNKLSWLFSMILTSVFSSYISTQSCWRVTISTTTFPIAISPNTALSSSVEEDLRKERMKDLSVSSSSGLLAAMMSTAFIDAGEKTKLEVLARVEITFPARNIDTSFCFFIASAKSIFDREGLEVTCDAQSFCFFFGFVSWIARSATFDLPTFSFIFMLSITVFRVFVYFVWAHINTCTFIYNFFLWLGGRPIVGLALFLKEKKSKGMFLRNKNVYV